MPPAADGSFPLSFGGEDWLLLPCRALLHPATSSLFLADLHWGKAAVFQANGIPLPDGSLEEDLGRLDAIIGQYSIRRMYFLGDLLHGPQGQTEEVIQRVSRWIARHRDALELHFVEGNHDRAARGVPPGWGLHALPAGFSFQGVELRHEPPAVSTAGPCLAGHLHPRWRVRLGPRENPALPAFVMRRNCLILPAFGSLTGGRVLRPEKGDRAFLVTEKSVIPV